MASLTVATTFTPLHDRILLRRVEEGETVRGGIIIPDSAKEKPQEGEVISLARASQTTKARRFRLMCRLGIGCCSASTPGPRSRSMAKSF